MICILFNTYSNVPARVVFADAGAAPTATVVACNTFSQTVDCTQLFAQNSDMPSW